MAILAVVSNFLATIGCWAKLVAEAWVLFTKRSTKHWGDELLSKCCPFFVDFKHGHDIGVMQTSRSSSFSVKPLAFFGIELSSCVRGFPLPLNVAA
jgi:hypothetical protein